MGEENCLTAVWPQRFDRSRYSDPMRCILCGYLKKYLSIDIKFIFCNTESAKPKAHGKRMRGAGEWAEKGERKKKSEG